MVAGSILPVTWCNGKLLFLFGKECNMEDSARGWSDFGGGCETCVKTDSFRTKTRKVFDTAIREGVEETTGFLGTQASIRRQLVQANTRYLRQKTRRRHNSTKLSDYMSLTHDTYTVYFMPMEYDERLPHYYNDNHRLLWNNMDRKALNRTKLFEKIEVGWFSEEEMVSRREEFRGFYRDIVDRILDKIQKERKSFISFVRTGCLIAKKAKTQRLKGQKY